MNTRRFAIVPAILAHDAREFRAKLHTIEHAAPLVQIDVMDGQFVPNTTWADPRVVGRCVTPTTFEVHLMVREPHAAVMAWGRLAHVRRIIVHMESTKNLPELLNAVRTTRKEVGLAVNPATPLRRILPHFAKVDVLLIMANAPGFSGKPFRSATLRRIAAVRRRFPGLTIGVDIGVNARTIPRLVVTGASYGAAASTIFGASDPVAAYHDLVRIARRSPR